MSRKTLLSRPRTRLYDANYNIGESYYRPALERLDRKYSGRPLSPPPRNSFGDIAERHARIFAEEDLDSSRKRAEKLIRDENLFDSRGARIAQRAVAANDNFDNDINNETAATLKRIRASKKVSVIDDVDLEGVSNNLKSSRLLDRSEKILDSVGINDSPRRAIENGVSSYKRKALKVTFDTDGDEELDKWTPVENSVRAVKARQQEEVTSVRARREESSASIRSESSAAAIRAKQTKERISDIEEEMAAMAEKQAAREARVARLRALVAETEQESEALEVAQAAAERRSARREKLQS